LPFWSEIAQQNKAHLQSWISEQFEFLLQAATVTVAYIFFRVLRVIGVEGELLDLMEKLEHGTVVIVFALFLLGVIRRSFGALWESKTDDLR
jgi:hypothetical protein